MDLSRKNKLFHRDRFPLAIVRMDPQPPITPHSHDFWELVVITGGQGTHVSGRSTFQLSEGDVFVISEFQWHNYTDMKDLCLINILFDSHALNLNQWGISSLPGYQALFTLEPNWRKSRQYRNRLHISGRDLSSAIAMIDQLDNELIRREPGFQSIAASTFMQLVVYLSRRYQQSPLPDTHALLRLGGAIAHLEQLQNEPVSLDDLAHIAHMSKRNFLRAFKKATGTSPIKHLLRRRITRAAADLRQKGQNITQIAFDHGFNDSNYFSRQFHQVMGMSPREYQKQFQSLATR